MEASWIDSAEAPGADFPLANLPLGVMRTGRGAACVSAIGDRIVDLALLERAGLVDAGGGGPVFDGPALNDFIALGPPAWERLRAQLTGLLAAAGRPALRDDPDLRRRALPPLAGATMLMPVRVAGYTDFNGARQHAFNAGSILRGPDRALPANWLHMPIAYNGRVSTVCVSGTPIRRPLGQFLPQGGERPVFGPSRRLDFELELGTILGVPSRMGEPLSVAEADAMIFGHVLLNDWSARDIQAWETVPLGPFLGKAFGTSISPWVVTRAALEPFRIRGPEPELPLLPYLHATAPLHHDIALEAALVAAGAADEAVIVRTNTRHLYYAPAQMLAQHAIGGCRMDVCDLIGSGTVSGPDPSSWACLLEITRGGREALQVAGLRRTYLEDGDTVVIRGAATRDGRRIGFGECRGTILPAPPHPAGGAGG